MLLQAFSRCAALIGVGNTKNIGNLSLCSATCRATRSVPLSRQRAGCLIQPKHVMSRNITCKAWAHGSGDCVPLMNARGVVGAIGALCQVEGTGIHRDMPPASRHASRSLIQVCVVDDRLCSGVLLVTTEV
jgi:hypothetical protein